MMSKDRSIPVHMYIVVELNDMLCFSEQLMELMHARARRRFARGLKRKPMALVKKLRRAKKEAPPNEKPEIVKTHLRNMIIVPEMVGSIVGIYNGKTFNQVGNSVYAVCFIYPLPRFKIDATSSYTNKQALNKKL